jgi:hypothetical protein
MNLDYVLLANPVHAFDKRSTIRIHGIKSAVGKQMLGGIFCLAPDDSVNGWLAQEHLKKF